MNRLILILTNLALCSLLIACGGSDDMKGHRSSSNSSQNSVSSTTSSIMSSEMSSTMSSSSAIAMVTVKYAITVNNITAGQPLSPVAVVLHKPGYIPFVVGMPVSVGIEKIAESGNPGDFLAEVDALETTVTQGRAESPLMPGNQNEIMLTTEVEENQLTMLQLSLVSMLGNTNDGLTAISAENIGWMEIGESKIINTLSYDAGTEANTETMETVPGPISGGEGFNAARDDIADAASLHPGAVTQLDDASSALTSMQRWDNPVARITITRMAP